MFAYEDLCDTNASVAGGLVAAVASDDQLRDNMVLNHKIK